MTRISIFSLLLAFGVCAASAQTFYTGQNQNPQFRYSPTGPSPMSAQAQGNQWQHMNPWQTQQARQQQWGQPQGQRQQTQQQQWQSASAGGFGATGQPGQQRMTTMQQPRSTPPASDEGLRLFGGISHQSAAWHFDMNRAGSILQFDNLAWTVLDLGGNYTFDAGDMKLRVEAGVKFGMQSGDGTMLDDDITNGGGWLIDLVTPGTDQVVGAAIARAVSIGRSTGGSMFDYNVGIGLTDKFQLGNARITPGVGWRNTSYHLKTNRNNGLVMTVAEGQLTTCWRDPQISDEIQCTPFILINNGTSLELIQDLELISGGEVIIGNNYFFSQPGTSHDYKVEWAGPYLAVGVEYDINQFNSVDARFELGLPGYKATGDQPYRSDWMHPKSVEDTADIGAAMHIGFGANWNTTLSDNIMFSLGMTYDYFSVSNARARTFLNGAYWDARLLNNINTIYGGDPAAAAADPNSLANEIWDLYDACPNWICTFDNEVNSFYKSIGIRVGLSARF